MRLARGEHGHAPVLVGVADGPFHFEGVGHLGQGQRKLLARQLEAVQAELDALEEHPLFFVGVLVGSCHVPAVAVNELGNRRHKPGPVRGRQEEPGGRPRVGSVEAVRS